MNFGEGLNYTPACLLTLSQFFEHFFGEVFGPSTPKKCQIAKVGEKSAQKWMRKREGPSVPRILFRIIGMIFTCQEHSESSPKRPSAVRRWNGESWRCHRAVPQSSAPGALGLGEPNIITIWHLLLTVSSSPEPTDEIRPARRNGKGGTEFLATATYLGAKRIYPNAKKKRGEQFFLHDLIAGSSDCIRRTKLHRKTAPDSPYDSLRQPYVRLNSAHHKFQSGRRYPTMEDSSHFCLNISA